MKGWRLFVVWAYVLATGACAKSTPSSTREDAGTVAPSASSSANLASLPTFERAIEVCRLIVASGAGRNCKPVLPGAVGPVQFDVAGPTVDEALGGGVFTFVDDYGYESAFVALTAEGMTVGRDGTTRTESLTLGSRAARTVVVADNEMSADNAIRLRTVVDGLR